MERTDVVVVGSGYGGTIPATRLAQAGMKVVVLERGVRMSGADFKQSDDTTYLQQVIDYVLSSANIGIRTGKLLGGASNNMDGAFFRTPSDSFAVTEEGRRVWPEALSRQELDKYYPKVEQMFKVRQMGWDEIPKGGGLFAKLCDNFGASCDLSWMNYTDCVQCGFCTQGCKFDKKMSLLLTYIPLAEQAGAEFRTGCMATTIEPDGTGYIVNYQHAGESKRIACQRLIVAGGGVHSPALLLRSRSALPGLSAHVGEHFNTNGEHTYLGVLPDGFDDLESFDVWKGMDNAGLMSFHFWESDKITLHPGGGFEPSILGANFSAPAHPVLPEQPFGMAYKRFGESVYRHRLIGIASLGLSPSHLAVTLKVDGSADLALRPRVGHDAYLERLDACMYAMAEASGVTIVDAIAKKYSGTTSAHLLASCRMADRKEDGVVDHTGQVFGYENLYLCDASTVPYAIGVNPALTISAIAERTAEHIIAKG